VQLFPAREYNLGTASSGGAILVCPGGIVYFATLTVAQASIRTVVFPEAKARGLNKISSLYPKQGVAGELKR
jgi:hypothetical protein